MNSLADCNDYFELEHRKAWEPSDSSLASPVGEGKEAQFGFPYRNQIT